MLRCSRLFQAPRIALSLGLLALMPGFGRAQSYGLNATASHVYVKVDKGTPLAHAHGVQGSLASATLNFGGKGSGELVFNMTSFTADTPEARRFVGLSADFSAADAHRVTAAMQGKDVLDVGKYPRATFAISTLAPLDHQEVGEEGRYRLDGRFTLHGVTQPLSVVAKTLPGGNAGEIRLRGWFAVLGSAYGIKPASTLGGLIKVADRLEIWGDVVLVPQPAGNGQALTHVH